MRQSSEVQYDRMMNTPIPRLVMSLALPTILSTMITVIYNTADTYFVSQINKSASAAVGAVFSIMSVIQAVGFGFAMGAGSLISLKLGEKDNRAADTYCATGFFCAVVLGALIGILGLCFLEPILRLLCSPTMIPHARSYAAFILIAAPISCSTFVLNNVLRAQGQARLAMWGMMLGGGVNMVLDPFFIFDFGLGMGAGGAALATAISQCVSFSILLSFFLRGKSIVSIHPRYISRVFGDYTKIVLTGIPTVCRQGLGSIAAAVLNIQAVAYGCGDDALASAATIANKIYMLTRNFLIGLGQGFQPVAGYNYGAGNRHRAWLSFRFATVVGSLFSAVAAILIALFRAPIMDWMSNDPGVIRLGSEMLLYLSAVIPVLAFSTFVNQLAQCLGFKLSATLLASCRQGFFFLPAIYILPLFMGSHGVLASQAVADGVTFAVSVPFLVWFYRKYMQEKTL